MRRLLVITLFLFLPLQLLAQVRVVSPLPNGLLQVRGEHALLHVRVSVPQSINNFSISLLSDTSTQDPYVVRRHVDPTQGWYDTVLDVPPLLREYTLWWFADSAAQPLQGSITGLTPGHVFGIAGQSNAAGYDYGMIVQAEGDIRMLHNDVAWEHAREPTANLGGGPWIVMANELYRMIGDSLPIGIVNVAVGATGLTLPYPGGGQWLRDSLHPNDSGTYELAIHRLRETGGLLEALLWIQGEADCVALPDPEIYRAAFKTLVDGFHIDLKDTFPVFHLQIAGYEEHRPEGFTFVREAHRRLPPSTLVGTAVGRELQGDKLHYTISTYTAVGKMFADALLRERYGKNGMGFYPPLMPDSLATLGSNTNPIQQGKYCFSLRFTRATAPVRLTAVSLAQYFTLQMDSQMLDTSKVWYRISPTDSSSVQIGLKNGPIDPSHVWRITYDAIGETDRAPIATIDPLSHDTIFGTAFTKLPVTIPQDSFVRDANDPGLLKLYQNGDNLYCIVSSASSASAEFELYNSAGVAVLEHQVMLTAGMQMLSFDIHALSSGVYWLRLSANGGSHTTKLLIIR